MIKKILISNRGEIAVRVISTAREMGIKTVAVYSDFDRFSMFAKYADESYHIGESPASKSYLLADRIIETALKCGADAIHPGYGFLSERSYFARLCNDNNIKFIGPSPEAIEYLGSKTNAKSIAIKSGVPTVPGTDHAISGLDEAKLIAGQIGYPVLIKASAGGGGKGMRIVNNPADLDSALRLAQNEARSSFGDDSVFIEKYIIAPRHIEFQILADEYGNAIHLGERECSMQRRHQKVIEETPSVIIDKDLRDKMGEAARNLAKAAGYTNAGTVEFIVDSDKNFYFLEMNTRLQVEHPVTEVRTGIDLVKEQILVASGEKLSYSQESVTFNGAAIECRICAEDPDNNFIPSTGKINYLSKILGNGVREDTGIEHGDEISIYYDSMIAKLICFGNTRPDAINKMKRTLSNYQISGVKTNIKFLLELLNTDAFKNGCYNTQFIENEFMNNKKSISSDEDNLSAGIVASVNFKQRLKGEKKLHITGKRNHTGGWKSKRFFGS
ncbi:acetyl-CoA carboxylase biotin carboxylase subunit [Ignavibacteria bacterium CHB1]|nr:MAG: acetyl-CoA carboxylase biotin carboxylase subunit [Chlorobiota bacterium]MBV6399201.1 2-oxoglutarate carboxylase small subunit [Ignavibacteria bacterium]MCC6885352.1 acetyl-CoA carboxylase biotin carboxylase subunit [Ignavibacteriales bacterium]MCE7953595.1 acetyl-CoA carboxylase biotin carboxylase subunit [Chlorobi bacterium CHB7]MDL1887515.1 acetyl-CoA carboxylase biotin carboxylase subunit [Ignavibacteria bacterium CHB1]RIK49220.1 MAG: acetyl-CoA carboxylase biotin carboxylase subun